MNPWLSIFTFLTSNMQLEATCDIIVDRYFIKATTFVSFRPYFFVHYPNLQLGLFNPLTQSDVLPVICALI